MTGALSRRAAVPLTAADSARREAPGGTYLSYSAAKPGEMGTGPFHPLAGMGRNVYGGITVTF